MPKITAVLLAGAGGSRLYPLNAAGTPKVLLPVANRPLLTFPLRMLEESGVADVLVVSRRRRPRGPQTAGHQGGGSRWRVFWDNSVSRWSVAAAGLSKRWQLTGRGRLQAGRAGKARPGSCAHLLLC